MSIEEFEGLKNDFASGNFEANLTNLEQAIFDDQGKKKGAIPEWICKSWSVIKPALKLAKLFTPNHIDTRIDKILKLGDEIC